MAILVDALDAPPRPGADRQRGRFHGLRNRDYGTGVVAGVTPGKGGQEVEGIPVFGTVADAVAATGANTSLVFVPAPLRRRRRLRGDRRRHRHHRLHHRVHPGARHAAARRLRPRPRRDADRAELPGRALARAGQRRDHPGRGVRAGPRRPRLALGHAHLPDRQRARPARDRQLDDRRHRRRPVVGSTFVDILDRFEADPETELVVLVGEIGGDEEEKAAGACRGRVQQAGARLHRRLLGAARKAMGHAGAIISRRRRDGAGEAARRSRRSGSPSGTTPTELARARRRAAAGPERRARFPLAAAAASA